LVEHDPSSKSEGRLFRKPVPSFGIMVSTKQQHRSGLGIEAQRAAVTRFAETECFQILAEYVEADTGKGADALDRRPELAAALARARAAKCRPAPTPSSRAPSWLLMAAL
jgi:hypothetical protein